MGEGMIKKFLELLGLHNRYLKTPEMPVSNLVLLAKCCWWVARTIPHAVAFPGVPSASVLVREPLSWGCLSAAVAVSGEGVGRVGLSLLPCKKKEKEKGLLAERGA